METGAQEHMLRICALPLTPYDNRHCKKTVGERQGWMSVDKVPDEEVVTFLKEAEARLEGKELGT